MPIKGLTDQKAAFPQIGILRKGAEKPKTGNAPGKDLEYFRFTSDDATALTDFAAAYGDKPADVNVFLPYRTAAENFSAWREEWVAGGLVHRCDGETKVVWRDKGGNYQTAPQPCDCKRCKPVGRLSVIVRELSRLAFVTAQTTSLHDIMELSRNLAELELLRNDLRGIPLILRRRPRKVSTPDGKGGRCRREKWLLTIEAAPQWVALQIAAQQAAAIPQLPAGTTWELEAPDDENGVTVDAETGEILDTAPEWPGEVFKAGEDAPPEPEPEPAPKPAPKEDNEAPVITSPKELLAAVNNATTGHFHSIPHMLNAVRKVLGDDGWGWPAPNDADGYTAAYNVLIDYAAANK